MIINFGLLGVFRAEENASLESPTYKYPEIKVYAINMENQQTCSQRFFSKYRSSKFRYLL